MERLDYRKMASSEVQENFVELRVLGQKSIMKKPIVRRANKKETWQDFLQNTCGLQVSKKDGIYVRTVLSSTRLRRSDGEKYGWTAELDDKIGPFIGKFWQKRTKNTVYLLRKRPVPNQGGGVRVNSPLPLAWYLPNESASSSSEQVPEEINEEDYVRRVTLEKVEICSDSEGSEQEADDTSQEPVNPRTESTSDLETEMEYEERQEMPFNFMDPPPPVVELDNENRKEDDAGNENSGQKGNMSFGSSDPLVADHPRVRVKVELEEDTGSGMTGDHVNWDSCSSTTSRQEDDENSSFFTSFPRFSSQRPMPASSIKDVAKKELERCSNGYLSKIKHELEDLKARNMWQGIEDKSPLASRLLEDLFKL